MGLKDDLEETLEMGRSLRTSIADLSDHVGALGRKISVTNDVQNRITKAQTKMNWVLGAIAVLLVGLIIVLSLLVQNGNRIDDLQDDSILNQCETTAIFLDLVKVDPEATLQEMQDTKNFLAVYEDAFRRLNCADVLARTR